MTDMTPEQRVYIAFHEAGHAVATVLSGGRVGMARIVDNDPTTIGMCETYDHHERDDALIAWAGPYAEALARWGDKGRPDVRTGLLQVLAASGRRDQSVIDLAKMRDVGYSDDHRTIEKHLKTCWRAVGDVATALIDGPVTHTDVTRALGLSSDPEVSAHQLHLIRAGRKPGRFSVTKVGETLHVSTLLTA
ncbi:M50 family metallopeptidase [Williamsia maris]|uniref:Peptidase M50B-like n=1 Tax=Williamsia maris TaxID=72806 RepID=A0ABT1HL64_9NOCA|nr:M50 family metallopeptidase [Williamsia maris]MCP2178684.1 Peptidase M50B-like [Williamsia maris]